MYPGLWSGASSTPTSAQELCGTWNQFHSQGRRQEVRSGYFVVSLVNKLWGHILFPFLSLLLSHIFSNSESLSKTSATELAHSLGKFPTGTESQDPSVLGDGFEGKSEDQKRWTNALHRIPEALFTLPSNTAVGPPRRKKD